MLHAILIKRILLNLRTTLSDEDDQLSKGYCLSTFVFADSDLAHMSTIPTTVSGQDSQISPTAKRQCMDSGGIVCSVNSYQQACAVAVSPIVLSI
jgi:hypothetical protein